MAELHLGDCLDVLRTMPDASVDSVVTDPPYGLRFMGKAWDYDVPTVEVWREVFRVLKPGGHLLAFAGTRTQHRMACAIEDAGFEIRDMIAWVYGSGFPKSLDVSKAIDKAAGAEREVVGQDTKARSTSGAWALPTVGGSTIYKNWDITAPATEAAKQWEGWGTALKPSLEPITVARRPLAGTVAENVLRHGTGGINVDGCRVAHDEECRMMAPLQANIDNPSEKHRQAGRREAVLELKPGGRWPANLIHDGSDEVVGLFPQTGPSQQRTGKRTGKRTGCLGAFSGQNEVTMGHNDAGGSAARFFYTAKANKAERKGSKHPTVKPLDLMRYLCRLVTPPGGVVLDPFMGSGTTIEAALAEGFQAVGIERDLESFEDTQRRIDGAQLGLPL